jgi:hypothetical protein
MRPVTFIAFIAGLAVAILLMQIDRRHRDAIDLQRDQINRCDKAERLLHR